VFKDHAGFSPLTEGMKLDITCNTFKLPVSSLSETLIVKLFK